MKLILAIRRHDTPLTKKIYEVLVNIRKSSIPSFKPIHLPLYWLICKVPAFLRLLNEKLILTPAFKTRLNTYGKGLRVCRMPFVQNDNLVINVGDNVTFVGNNDFSGGKVYDQPVITFGSNITVGYGSTMSCAQSITIGDNCKIASNVYITDNDGHPTDPERRNGDITKDEVKAVTIGDNVWLCTGCTILKGSSIGKNSVIGAHAVVSGEVPENSIAVGNPAIIKPLYVKYIF